MEKIFFSFIILLFISHTSCTSVKTIGIKENDKYVLNGDLSGIKEDWKKMLSDQKINTVLTNFEIKSGVDNAASGKIYYILVGYDKEGKTKIANLLQLKNGKFLFYPNTKTKAEEGNVICSGCSPGCEPQRMENRWVCAPECGTNCRKTVTVNF